MTRENGSVWRERGPSFTVKVKTLKQSHYRPGQALRVVYFKTIGTWRWQRYQPYAPAAFTPQEIFLVLISVRG